MASSRTVTVGGASIQIDFSAGAIDLPPDAIIDWVEHAARAVATYYGRYPVPRERVLVVFVPDESGVGGGTTWGDVGGMPAFTRIHVGQHTKREDLADDWMMTHEMVHTAFPSQTDEHHWIEEGLATYIEPIARVQAGFLPPERIWRDMFRDMRKGNPKDGDRGLDQTHTWGRTYWGGAQFCLLADVTIRKLTRNAKGLQDALRGILGAGGTIDHEWPLTKAFSLGDEATATHVLMNQYGEMANAPKPVDLDAIWKDLGVDADANGGVRLDDAAPFASIRQAITRAPDAAKNRGSDNKKQKARSS
ncbi:MAG TPA: hypothetical protein VFW25_00560 [Silvibacterium sp.]|nr:hypothetical protein [Silvibacterium sp.]